ncbi:MAG: 2-aminoethylphosphonate--pyruvate transaminase [Coprobacillus sp.]
MKNYKLLTPGPLTTTQTVKEQMMFDHCTWDDDYKQITQKIRRQLLELAHVSEEDYTTILMQGSGTFGVESVFTSVISDEEKVLIVANGAYGDRMCDMCDRARINYTVIKFAEDENPDAHDIEEVLKNDSSITHVAVVHSETTSGILNDIESVSKVTKAMNKVFIVDAMSSFGGIDIPVKELGIDFIVSSANKCIQGVPGFSFVIANKQLLIESQGKARSLSLDLYDQWLTMNKDGKWRFTSPTHVVLAFSKAIDELLEEGGIAARSKRYYDNNRLLIEKMAAMGMKSYVDLEYQGPIITTFYYPEGKSFAFEDMYNFIKERGYAIYPGKLTTAQTFRIGNIGEIYEEDMLKLCDIIQDFLKGV